jgi:hypothetical protein
MGMLQVYSIHDAEEFYHSKLTWPRPEYFTGSGQEWNGQDRKRKIDFLRNLKMMRTMLGRAY